MPPADDFDLLTFTPYLLNQAADATSRAFEGHYKARYGMLRTEWRVLFHLGRYGDLTATAICQRAGLHKTKVSRAVGALAAKRFLTRQEQARDRRQEVLSLTPQGRRVFEELSDAASAFDRSLMARFAPAERAVLRKLLIEIAGL